MAQLPAELLTELLDLLRQLLDFEREQAQLLESVVEPYRASARNLLHCIAFHRHNHPGLQQCLRDHGLSTLAGCDPHLLDSLLTLISVVRTLLGQPAGPDQSRGMGLNDGRSIPDAESPLRCDEAHDVLRFHSERLLGASPAILVTLPAEAVDRPELIDELVAAGMDVARINCAHDNPAVWQALVERVRSSAQARGRTCRIAMDLGGPKLRTGPLPPVPAVVSVNPTRDRYGRMVQPARILGLLNGAAPGATGQFTGWTSSCSPETAPSIIPLQVADPGRISPGDRLRGRDASRRMRQLLVVETGEQFLLLQCDQHCRFTAGLVFRQLNGSVQIKVGPMADAAGELRLRVGDRLLLALDSTTAEHGQGPATISCTLPEVLDALKVGDRVLFDDGRISALVSAVKSSAIELDITQARPKGSRLRADQGINLPDTSLSIPALTSKDLQDLSFIAQHADLLSYSFVSTEADVDALHRALQDQAATRLGVVLKIETRQAFLNLPRLLFAAMRQSAPIGVMIARGDLAIECGWESLARIQEEILQICAAAHVPCIWATQVLDSLAHDGRPTRAEITDAAMGARADALMLNKGANIANAVRSLRRIIQQSGITRADNSTRHPEQLMSCVSFADLL